MRPGVKCLRSIPLCFSCIFLLAAPAGAQSPLPVEAAAPAPATPVVRLESGWIAADESGAEERLAAAPPLEGPPERIYTGRFHYRGDAPARGLRIVLPIPAGMRYIGGSATGPGARLSYSIDGGRSFAPPEALLVPLAPPDAVAPGTGETAADQAAPTAATRRAGPEDYTHIRWDLPGRYAPGTRGLVSFRAIPRAAGTATEDDMAPETT